MKLFDASSFPIIEKQNGEIVQNESIMAELSEQMYKFDGKLKKEEIIATVEELYRIKDRELRKYIEQKAFKEIMINLYRDWG